MSRHRTNTRERNSGFTLLELIVVVSIMAVLAGAALPVARTVFDRAARKATLEELDVLARACGELFRDTRTLPSELEDLWSDPGSAGWAGPYVRVLGTDARTGKNAFLVDGWSFDYVLVRRGDSVLELASPGADGRMGELDDHTLVLDVTSIRREQTLASLGVLNGAIERHNRTPGTEDLAPPASAVISRLVATGFLPAASGFRTDAFGDAFECDPPDRAPVVRLRSATLSH